MKKLLLFLAILLCLGSAAVALAGGLDVEVVCPTNVRSGGPLVITVYAYNYDCYNSVTVNRAMTGLGGNSGGTVGNAGLWGPYNKTINRTIPAATCNWPNPIIPGELDFPLRVTVVDAAPNTLVNTMAGVFFGFVTVDGQMEEGDGCMVNVVP